MEDFSVGLEAEERQMKEALEIVNEKFTAYISDVEESLLMLKSHIKQKLQQKDLDKEKAEFRNLSKSKT